ncbi:YesN/AraC family two-component response regulator [Wenyingzhuangia heitensis]|uniref:YesN/AraC family two-component response regulator n=1 Tax=Wenyingzhuangia heitensis TaxID=1487859 RepID=A0ABX0UD35_9FLAO|nr:AraC family transcriptional regulator [Wenyingzhuangia heitensis]NIJ46254.1 YesN/AraC family two-component response regulator [Wenyingzhuangia heitensis]
MKNVLEVHHQKNKYSSFTVKRFDESSLCPHVELHLHTDYEIVYLKKGKGTIKIAHQEIDYRDGVLMFLGPYIPHYGLLRKALNDNFEIVIHFNEFLVNNQLQVFPEFSSVLKRIKEANRVLIFNHEIKEELGVVFEKMIKQDASEQLISLFSILSTMSKRNTCISLLSNGGKITEGYSKKMIEILEYINANFQNNISTKDIAVYFNLTPNSFCRYFKKISSQSFLQFLNEFRVNNAIYLLETTTKNISEIMYLCGFTNFSYFSKQFKKITNQSPSNYRKLSQLDE